VPGVLGGHNWQPMYYSPTSGLVYIPVHETAATLETEVGYKTMLGGVGVGVRLENFEFPDSPVQQKEVLGQLKGYLLAWDPVAGREAWRAPHPTFDNGGILSTAGNLVIQGDTDGFLNIYNATTGEQLWRYDVDSAVLGAPISWSAEGRQYISVIAGFGGGIALFGGRASWGASGPRHNKSRVLTFALDGQAHLVPSEPAIALTTRSPPPQFAAAARIKVGENAFNRTCANCHGYSAISGGVVPDLRHSPALADATAWKAIAYDGVLVNAGMRGYKNQFSEQELEAVRAYVISRAEVESRFEKESAHP
jgi:quinohemoprotein ethanol dehydrogenase